MSLTFDELLAGPKLPDKEVYIEALDDSIFISPVPLERYRQYQNAESNADQADLITICVAESLSKQSGMTLDQALELNKQVQAKIHPAAWDEISQAVMVTMFGESRIKQAQALAGNV